MDFKRIYFFHSQIFMLAFILELITTLELSSHKYVTDWKVVLRLFCFDISLKSCNYDFW